MIEKTSSTRYDIPYLGHQFHYYDQNTYFFHLKFNKPFLAKQSNIQDGFFFLYILTKNCHTA